MTTVLSPEGQLVLPASVRRKLRLSPGDDLEVSVEGEHTITLRRVNKRAKRGLVDWLLSCPEKDWFQPLASESTDSL